MIARRRRLMLAIAGVPALTTSGCASLLLPSEVGFTAAELQRRLAEKFPWRKTFSNLFDVELSNPLVALDAARGRIGSMFDLNVRLTGFTRGVAGRIGLSGVPRFDDEKSALFLREPAVDEVTLHGVPPSFNDNVQRLLRTLAVEVLNDTPLYTLKPGDDRLLGQTVRPGDIRVTADRLVIGLVKSR